MVDVILQMALVNAPVFVTNFRKYGASTNGSIHGAYLIPEVGCRIRDLGSRMQGI